MVGDAKQSCHGKFPNPVTDIMQCMKNHVIQYILSNIKVFVMKIKTVLFMLLLSFITPVVAGANSGLEKATVRLNIDDSTIAYIDVIPDDGGDVKLTADEILQKVTEKNIKRIQVIYDSDKDGSLYISGDSKKGVSITATRSGNGDGDAKRNGDGDGSAMREGNGDGNAIRNGDGDGVAWRTGAGNGDAIRKGTGGNALHLTTGIGAGYVNGVKR